MTHVSLVSLAKKVKPLIQQKIKELRTERETSPKWGQETEIKSLVKIQTLLKKIKRYSAFVDQFIMNDEEMKLIKAAHIFMKENRL